jgi:YbbR domain-containing protein
VQIIRKNLKLKLLALVLAILGWAYFRFAGGFGTADGQTAQQVSVPIGTVNLPVGYVAHYVEREAVVTVDAKRGDPPVKPDEVKAVLDLANKGTGIYNVPITLVAPALAIQSLSPASVTLTIERIETRTLPATLHYVGSESSAIVVAQSSVLPRNVTVRGATSTLEQIVAVQLDMPFAGEPKSVDEMVRPIPVNAAGSEISGVTIQPDLVRAQISFVAGSGAVKP